MFTKFTGNYYEKVNREIIRCWEQTPDILFCQMDNYYFLCCMKENLEQQNLDKHEADEGFTHEFCITLKFI